MGGRGNDKQEPCNKLKQNQRAAAVVFKLMSRKQKYTNLQTKKGFLPLVVISS